MIGVGTNQFGRTSYEDVRSILRRMHELGGTVIDTAAARRGPQPATITLNSSVAPAGHVA